MLFLLQTTIVDSAGYSFDFQTTNEIRLHSRTSSLEYSVEPHLIHTGYVPGWSALLCGHLTIVALIERGNTVFGSFTEK